MSNKNPGIDEQDLELNIFRNATPSDGSLNIDLEIRAALNEAISKSGKRRSQICAELFDLTQTEVSNNSLNTWTAESKSKSSDNEDFSNNKRWGIPAELIPALCHVTGDNRPLEILLKVIGLEIMTKDEQVALQISRLEEQRKKIDKKIKVTKKLYKKVRL